MAKKPNKREVIKRFIDTYMNKFPENPDPTRLLMNMIADGITDPERLRNYMIVHDYYGLLRQNNGHCSITLIQLAETYFITERQIQNILYKWSSKYKVANNIAD